MHCKIWSYTIKLTITEPMGDASEEEQEEDLVLPISNRPKKENDGVPNSRAQRQEQLRRMMDLDGLCP